MNKISEIQIVCSIIAMTVAIKKKKMARENTKHRRKRALWSHKWLLQRSCGHGLSSMVMKELRLEDPKSFQNFVRMKRETFEELLVKVGPLITKQDTLMREAISPTTRLLITLRFLATGERFKQLSYSFRVAFSTISTIVPETLETIYSVLKDDFLKLPQCSEEWKTIADEFEEKWNFPHCLGAIDGKHIAIGAKKEYGSLYYNYKCFHSVILLAVVDANYKFLYVDVGVNGRANDAAAFNESSLCEGIEKNLFHFPDDAELAGMNCRVPFVFVADDAFRLSSRVLKPYGVRSANANRVFNYRLSRARRVVENAFGILANKFQIFQKDIHLSVDKVESLTLAACALHNFIRTKDGFNREIVDYENTNCITMENGSWRNTTSMTNLEEVKGNRSGNEGRKVRDLYSQYFNTSGAVPWQLKAVQKFNF